MSQTTRSSLRFNPNIAAAPLYVAGTAIEAVRQQYQVEEVVKLASNECPLGPSPRAMEAIQNELAYIYRYPPMAATDLYEALAAHVGRGLTADNFVVGHGASEVIDILTRGFIMPGENFIITPPTFSLYEIYARRCGAEMQCVSLDPGYGIDVEGILKAVNPQTRIVYLCTPNNPTGTIITPAQAERLAQGIPPDVLIVFDESYRVFVEDAGDLIEPADYVEDQPNVIFVRSLSKSYGLAGLRVGFAIASNEVAAYLRRLCLPFHLGSLALRAAIAALGDDEFLTRVRRHVLAERVWLAEQMETLDLEVIPTQANFIAVRVPFPPELIYERMVEHGVIIRPLEQFYMPGWFRVTVGTHHENERFIETLAQVLAALAEEGAPSQAAGQDARTVI